MTFKPSTKYLNRVKNYLEWVNVKNPATDTFQHTKLNAPVHINAENGLEAIEVLSLWETKGKLVSVCPDQENLLLLLLKGKAERDYWTKEIGGWNKNGVFIPEEFLHFLTPITFIELFGRAPIAELVRYYYDNNYSSLDFKIENLIKKFLISHPHYSYFDKDYRQHWMKVLIRMTFVFYIDPFIYRTKRKVIKWLKNYLTLKLKNKKRIYECFDRRNSK